MNFVSWQGSFFQPAYLSGKPRLTKRAPDVWDSAAFSSIFLASSFSCSQAESTPAHTQVTQTVRRLFSKTMKLLFFKSVFALLVTIILSACLDFPSKQPTVTQTTETAIQVNTATPLPTNTLNPNFIYVNSPDNRYTVKLQLSESPIKLHILNNVTNYEADIELTNRRYNKIFGEGQEAFHWSSDNKVIMFELYREPFPEKFEDDYSCFFAVNLETAAPVTANYSKILRGIDGLLKENDVVILSHPGLNDLTDSYSVGINCYRSDSFSECESSSISPSGNWEFSQWDATTFVISSLSGDKWEYTYPNITDRLNNSVSFVQQWTNDEKFVFFSPSGWYERSWVYGLFRMDLSNGEVISLIDKSELSNKYVFLSVSPRAEKIVYITISGKLVIRDLVAKTERTMQIGLSADEIATKFLWSPDETKLIFLKQKLDKENQVVSMDYFLLNTKTGDVIVFLKQITDYIAAKKITNFEVQLGQNLYSLSDGKMLK